MRGIAFSTYLLLVGAPALVAQTPLVIQRVTVIDVTTGNAVPEQTIVVTGSRIEAVGPAPQVRLPASARIIDGQGLYAIPGLWDMHTHQTCWQQVFYPLFIAHGITGIRDASVPISLDSLRRWREEIAAGKRVGPRQLFTGPSLDERTQPLGWLCDSMPINIRVSTPAEARRGVDSLQEAGADFIKTHNFYDSTTSRQIYFAIAAEARQRGIPFGGHVPRAVTAIEASDSGAQFVDHLDDSGDLPMWCAVSSDSADVPRCAAIAERFRRNHTWLVPTTSSRARRLVTRIQQEGCEATLRYFPDSLFRRGRMRTSCVPTAADSSMWAQRPLTGGGTMRILREAGMPMVAGTDIAPAWGAPGIGLHLQLAAFVEEGLTPLQALQTATLNPAQALGATDSLGTIAPGKLADLVLLGANPLDDIAHTERIRAVVANGRYFDRAALDALIAEVERRAR